MVSFTFHRLYNSRASFRCFSNFTSLSLLFLLLLSFFTPVLTDAFSLDFKWQQVWLGPGTLLSVLADLNNAVVWMVTTRPLFFKSTSPCTKSTNYKWYHRHSHFPQFFNSLTRSRYLNLFSRPFNFTLWSARRAKTSIRQVTFSLLIISWSGRLTKINWSICISKCQRNLGVKVSRTDSGLCIYHLFL